MNQDTVTECAVSICKCFIQSSPLTHKDSELISSLSQNDIYKFAKQHKLIGVFYAVFSQNNDRIPESLNDHFARRTKQITFKNFNQFKESKNIQALLAENKIFVLPYKGSAFGNQFYKSFSIRQSIDVDFAMSLSDLERIGKLMQSLSYAPVKDSPLSKTTKRTRAYYIDFPWRKKLNQQQFSLVEFHWAPAHKALYMPLDFSSHLNSNLKEFDVVDHALFVVIHHGALDIWGRLMHLIDLNQILVVLDHEQTKRFLSRADALGLRKFLETGLILLERIFDTSFDISKRYHISEKLLMSIERDILSSHLNGKWSENRQKLRYHLQLRDSRYDQFRCLMSLGRFWIFDKTGF